MCIRDSPSRADHAIVIDVSGSMDDQQKLVSAKNAGSIFINNTRSGEKFGLAEYADELESGYGKAETFFSIMDADGNRTAGITELRRRTADGWTPLGTGLLEGLAILNSVPEPERNEVRAIVLLSDGLENIPNFWANPPDWYASPPEPANTPVANIFNQLINRNILIHTVSLGPDSDPSLMQSISSGRGIYRHADIIEEVSGIAMSSFNLFQQPDGGLVQVTPSLKTCTSLGLSLPNYLAHIYEQFHSESTLQQRLWHCQYAGIQRNQVVEIPLETGMDYATISINWDRELKQDSIILKHPEGVVLLRAIGSNGVTSSSTSTNKVFRINNPKGGIWKLSFPFGIDASTFIMVSGKSITRGFLKVVNPPATFESKAAEGIKRIPLFSPTDTAIIALSLFGEEIIKNATISAQAFDYLGNAYEFSLNDNGVNSDQNKNDGVYTGVYRETTIGGVYNLEVTASWEETNGGKSTRIFHSEIAVKELDTDGDSIGDRTENRKDLNPNDREDAGKDNDGDGLVNWKEIQIETDLFDKDTDDGGADDGLEIKVGTNPLNPADDKKALQDDDNDGLPNLWEEAYGLNPNDADDANEDTDNDGLDNLAEFEAGTSPISVDTDGAVSYTHLTLPTILLV